MSLEHCVKSRPREKRRICIFILFAIVFVFFLLFTERRKWPRNKNKATRCWVRALLCSAAVHWLMDLPQSSAQSSSALYTVSSALSSLFSCVHARGKVGYVLVLFFFFFLQELEEETSSVIECPVYVTVLCVCSCLHTNSPTASTS